MEVRPPCERVRGGERRHLHEERLQPRRQEEEAEHEEDVIDPVGKDVPEAHDEVAAHDRGTALGHHPGAEREGPARLTPLEPLPHRLVRARRREAEYERARVEAARERKLFRARGHGAGETQGGRGIGVSLGDERCGLGPDAAPVERQRRALEERADEGAEARLEGRRHSFYARLQAGTGRRSGRQVLGVEDRVQPERRIVSEGDPQRDDGFLMRRRPRRHRRKEENRQSRGDPRALAHSEDSTEPEAPADE